MKFKCTSHYLPNISELPYVGSPWHLDQQKLDELIRNEQSHYTNSSKSFSTEIPIPGKEEDEETELFSICVNITRNHTEPKRGYTGKANHDFMISHYKQMHSRVRVSHHDIGDGAVLIEVFKTSGSSPDTSSNFAALYFGWGSINVALLTFMDYVPFQKVNKWFLRIARTIEAKLKFDIILAKPVQVLDDDTLPLIAGKKMAFFVVVRCRKNSEGKTFPGHSLVLKTSPKAFYHNTFKIPLDTVDTIYPKPETIISEKGDGACWNKEEIQQLIKNEKKEALEFFRLDEKDFEDSDIRLYRFMLSPKNPNRNRPFNFSAEIVDDSGAISARVTLARECVKSPKFHVVFVPLRIGFWSRVMNPKTMIKHMADPNLQAFFPPLLAWTDISREEFEASMDEATRQQWDDLPASRRKSIIKALTKGKGSAMYHKLAEANGIFAKSVFPVAEERMMITILNDQPHLQGKKDIDKMSSRELQETLEKWLASHPRYSRVIGFVPGFTKKTGGVDIDTKDGTMGKHAFDTKRSALSAAWHDSQSIASHEMIHSLGVLDAIWTFGEMMSCILNRDEWPVFPGNPGITNGFWAAKKKFIGTPGKPAGSIMTTYEEKKLFWIDASLFKIILEAIR